MLLRRTVVAANMVRLKTLVCIICALDGPLKMTL